MMVKDILVVDDDKDILFTFKQLLNHQNRVVFTAQSGKECLKRLNQGFEGIVLIDIMMPEMDGWDTIHEIVQQGLQEKIDIIVITARGSHNHEKIHGLEPYIFDYIPKPFDIDTINNLLERLQEL